jgi:ABC-2 type transport system permease protein
MKNSVLLAKVMLKSAGPAWAGKKGSWWKNLLISLAVAVGVLPMMAAAVFFMSGLYDGLSQVGQESALLGLGLGLASLAIFLLGIVYVVTVFYYSQDVEHLLPLPLLPREILGAKFLVALLYEYLAEIILVAPVLITYGVKSGSGVLYYLVSLLIFLLLSIIPLVLAALITMLFMRFTNVGKSKDRFRLLGGLLAIIVAIGFQVFVQRQSSNLDSMEQMQQMIIAGENALLNLVSQLFPTTKLAVLALIEYGAWSGWGYLGTYVLGAGVGVAVFLFAGDRLYFAGVMGISESVAKRKKVDDPAFHKLVRAKAAWIAYAEKEWKILWRTPAFLLNCALPSFFMPVLGLVPFLSRKDSGDMLDSVGAWMQDEKSGGISLAIAFGVFLLTAAINSSSVTAITREGQGFFLNKSMPIPYVQILLAKLVPGLILGFISMLILTLEAAWFLALPPLFVVLALLVGLPGLICINMLSIMVDLHLPKLSWSSEQEAVKQNVNPLFPLIFGMLLAGLTVLGAISLNSSMMGMAGGLFLLFAIIDFILYRVLVTKGPVWMEKVEA